MEINLVKELIYWSYANLAMAHSAVCNGQKEYTQINFMIRSRLYKGLINNKMYISSFYEDEKIKINEGKKCVYCGSENELTIDHIFSKKKGGKDDADNLVCACKSCNSSKGSVDMMQWFYMHDKFPPLMILRRYLKLVYNYLKEKNLLDEYIEDIDDSSFPFTLSYIPLNFPRPDELIL